jgi:ribonuclease inhibitor
MTRQASKRIDLHAVRSAQQLQVLLRDELCFPSWYGKNWDAFWDAVTGLVPMPEVLMLVGWEDFQSRLPNEAEHFVRCMSDLAEKFPSWAPEVLYE